jgi:organic radical activating enzyme
VKVKHIKDEDFINYKKPSMFISTSVCGGKCWRELNLTVDLCQNSELVNLPTIKIAPDDICKRYLSNPITQSIVFGGLEPFDTIKDIILFLDAFRGKFNNLDDVVIYTGYTELELGDIVKDLIKYKNIIIKFGRFNPIEFGEPIFDEVLGVTLATKNQYAKKIC